MSGKNRLRQLGQQVTAVIYVNELGFRVFPGVVAIKYLIPVAFFPSDRNIAYVLYQNVRQLVEVFQSVIYGVLAGRRYIADITVRVHTDVCITGKNTVIRPFELRICFYYAQLFNAR